MDKSINLWNTALKKATQARNVKHFEQAVVLANKAIDIRNLKKNRRRSLSL